MIPGLVHHDDAFASPSAVFLIQNLCHLEKQDAKLRAVCGAVVAWKVNRTKSVLSYAHTQPWTNRFWCKHPWMLLQLPAVVLKLESSETSFIDVDDSLVLGQSCEQFLGKDLTFKFDVIQVPVHKRLWYLPITIVADFFEHLDGFGWWDDESWHDRSLPGESFGVEDSFFCYLLQLNLLLNGYCLWINFGSCFFQFFDEILLSKHLLSNSWYCWTWELVLLGAFFLTVRVCNQVIDDWQLHFWIIPCCFPSFDLWFWSVSQVQNFSLLQGRDLILMLNKYFYSNTKFSSNFFICCRIRRRNCFQSTSFGFKLLPQLRRHGCPAVQPLLVLEVVMELIELIRLQEISRSPRNECSLFEWRHIVFKAIGKLLSLSQASWDSLRMRMSQVYLVEAYHASSSLFYSSNNFVNQSCFIRWRHWSLCRNWRVLIWHLKNKFKIMIDEFRIIEFETERKTWI